MHRDPMPDTSPSRSAGRELDCEVAEKVMGWHGPLEWVDDDEGRDPYMFEPDANPDHIAANDRDWDCIVPRYSTDMDAALDLMSAMQRRGIVLALSRDVDAPLAIALAALAAVEASNG